jgi:Winged helix DNA-binding domain
VKFTALAARRLGAQRLVGEPLAHPVDVVRWFGAMQSQDYPAATWAVGQRARDATQASVDLAVDAGSILRTHVMRPTWHFVLPEDIGWLLALTAGRIRAGVTSRHRRLELDARTLRRAEDVIARALSGGRHCTRYELAAELEHAGVVPHGQRMPHILMDAELAGLIVSGPRRGRIFTYALLSDRVGPQPRIERDQALAELARRYFRAHGPAQLLDFVWWSGLTIADARAGLGMAREHLERRSVDGRDYWFDSEREPPARVSGIAHLLPNYDEYMVGYRDRSSLIGPATPPEAALLGSGSMLSNIVTVAGRIRGEWSRAPASGAIDVRVRPLAPLTAAETRSVERAATRLSRFVERPLKLSLARTPELPLGS